MRRSAILAKFVVGVIALSSGSVWASGSFCDPGTASASACSASATRLANSLPGLSVPSVLAGDSALIGSFALGQSNRPYPNGGSCPDMVICAGTGATDHAYREINIDYQGSFQRTSEVSFLMHVSQRDSLLAAGVQSLQVASVSYPIVGSPGGSYTTRLYIEPGETQGVLRLVAVMSGGLAIAHGRVEIGKDSAFPVQFRVESKLLGQVTQILVDGDVLFDSRAVASQFPNIGRPSLLRYGNLGVVSGNLPETPEVALVAGNWSVSIGELVSPLLIQHFSP